MVQLKQATPAGKKKWTAAGSWKALLPPVKESTKPVVPPVWEKTPKVTTLPYQPTEERKPQTLPYKGGQAIKPVQLAAPAQSEPVKVMLEIPVSRSEQETTRWESQQLRQMDSRVELARTLEDNKKQAQKELFWIADGFYEQARDNTLREEMGVEDLLFPVPDLGQKKGELGKSLYELERGSKVLSGGERELRERISQYKADPSEANWRAYEESYTAYRRSLESYQSTWERYEQNISAEGIARSEKRLEELNDQLKEAKREKASTSNVLAGVSRYGTSGQREKYEGELARATDKYDGIKEQISVLQKEIQQAKGLRYGAYRNEKDFARYAAQGAGMQNPSMNEAERGVMFGSWAPFGERIGNIVTYSRDNYDTLKNRDRDEATGVGDLRYHYMTEDEVGIYNYLLAKEGEGEAKQFLDYLEESLNYRMGTEQGENIRGVENGIGRTIATGIYGLGAGTDQFVSGAKQLFSEERLPTSPTQFGSAYIREDLKGSGPKVFGRSLGQLGYDLTNAAGNMAPSILLSSLTGGAGAPAAVAQGVGAASMGLSATGNAYNRALSEGYTKEEAGNYAALIGASEGSLQYLLGGIGKLGGKVTSGIAQRTIQNIDTALLRTAVDLGIKMGGEGLEESLQEILEPAFRNLAFDERNQIKLVSEDAAYAFLMGALTSAVMELPGAVGRANESGGVNVLVDEGWTDAEGPSVRKPEGVDIPGESGIIEVEEITGASGLRLGDSQELRATSPIDIPPEATVIVQTKTGYDQIKYKWKTDGEKYEARWHTRTPGAPESQGDTWVIVKEISGTPTGQHRARFVFTAKGWVSMFEWQQAVTARQNGIATAEQEALLTAGHWPLY